MIMAISCFIISLILVGNIVNVKNMLFSSGKTKEVS